MTKKDASEPQPPPTESQRREHVLSEDCWCKPTVVSYR